jgi:L-asparaginase II
VTGADRFIADMVYIPEDRRGMYMDDTKALKFANGRIIKDTWEEGIQGVD